MFAELDIIFDICHEYEQKVTVKDGLQLLCSLRKIMFVDSSFFSCLVRRYEILSCKGVIKLRDDSKSFAELLRRDLYLLDVVAHLIVCNLLRDNFFFPWTYYYLT